MPRVGDVFADVRDDGRTMRISCHEDQGTVVVSLWHNTLCRGSFRLAADDLGRFIAALAEMRTPLSAMATPAEDADGSAPDDADSGSAVTAPGTVQTAAPDGPEQAGDAAGTASISRPPSVPILRIA